MVWMVIVNGLHMDVHAPREIQEEAFKRGLILYLPELLKIRIQDIE
jgi:hypothetical protein